MWFIVIGDCAPNCKFAAKSGQQKARGSEPARAFCCALRFSLVEHAFEKEEEQDRQTRARRQRNQPRGEDAANHTQV